MIQKVKGPKGTSKICIDLLWYCNLSYTQMLHGIGLFTYTLPRGHVAIFRLRKANNPWSICDTIDPPVKCFSYSPCSRSCCPWQPGTQRSRFLSRGLKSRSDLVPIVGALRALLKGVFQSIRLWAAAHACAEQRRLDTLRYHVASLIIAPLQTHSMPPVTWWKNELLRLWKVGTPT